MKKQESLQNETTGTDKTLYKDLDTVDGADVTAGSYNSESWWKNTAGFAFGNNDISPWKMSGGVNPLPKLYWE